MSIDHDQKIENIRHSLAHIMAMTIKNIWPDVQFGIGPIIENGFYYDFDLNHNFTPEDLPKIEKEMKKLIKQDLKFTREELTYAEAEKLFKKLGQDYKLELIKDLKDEKISIYKSGDFAPLEKDTDKNRRSLMGFVDLCKGPHIESTKEIAPDAFKLTKIAGAYWKGDEKNKQLQRVYGIAFNNKKELEEYLKMVEEAEKRDHRKLGKELGLFIFNDLVGKGLPLWTEKGATVRREIEKFIVEEEIKRGYLHVLTPDIAKTELYETSGHYPYYKESMYPPMEVDDDKLILRPMTCPHHFVLYDHKIRSYKELPLKIAELAKLYRYEKSGELTGLIRVRNFCLADSHIFATESQAEEVIDEVLNLIEYANGILGFKKGEDYTYKLSLGDRKKEEKYYKNDRLWNEGEKALRNVLEKRKESFMEAKGEAAFYGPKIDIQMKNVLGKEDTAFTVQYDFCLPSRFKLKYKDENNGERQPIVIHRSSIGAIERTFAFMLEKFAGALPLWLSPVQVVIAPIGEKFNKYGNKVLSELKENGIRVELDGSNESLGKKIRNAEIQKIPYILVVGEKEEEADTVAVRSRKDKKQQVLELSKFITKARKEINEKILP